MVVRTLPPGHPGSPRGSLPELAPLGGEGILWVAQNRLSGASAPTEEGLAEAGTAASEEMRGWAWQSPGLLPDTTSLQDPGFESYLLSGL